MPREKKTRNPLGTILKKEIVRTQFIGGKEKKIKAVVYDARKRYKKPDGSSAEKFKRCRTNAEAVTALTTFANEIAHEAIEFTSKKTAKIEHTFFELVDYFEKEYVVPAVYSNNEKIIGYEQDLKSIKYILKDLKAFFGDILLSDFCYEDLRRYRIFLAQRPTRKGTLPKNGTINHYLGFLRRCFNVGIQLCWLTQNPFNLGASLIKNQAKDRRNRMLTFDEEERLLAECYDGEKVINYKRRDKLTKEIKDLEAVTTLSRGYLRAVIICALDTAMRKGEIQQLQWKEVFLDENYIFIDGKKTKTGIDGLAPLTPRLKAELQILKSQYPHNKNDLVFPFGDWKKAFNNAVRDAKIQNFVFHDLRSTAATRMLLAGNPGEMVRKITRHSQEKTFREHYTIVDIANTVEVGNKLSEFNSIHNRKVNDKVNKVIEVSAHSN